MKIITIPKSNKIIKGLKLPNDITIRTAVNEDIIAWGKMMCQYETDAKPDPEGSLHREKIRSREKPEITFSAIDSDGKVIGWARAKESNRFQLPSHCWLSIIVDKSRTGEGIGRILYAKLLEWAKTREHFTHLVTDIREDFKRSLAFLNADGGWKDIWHSFNQKLDVSKWDPNSYILNPEEILHKQGLEVVTLYGICNENREAILKEYYDLNMEIWQSIPRAFDVDINKCYEDFVKILDAPTFDPKWFLFAREKSTGKLVGTTDIWFCKNGEVWTGLTGTLSEYRRRGIASALKVIITRRIKDAGVKILGTGNDNGNIPMLRINERLGYIKDPIWIIFEKKITKITLDTLVKNKK